MSDEQMLSKHIIEEEKRLYQLEQQIQMLSTKLTVLETSVHDLVTAWNTASGVVSFVKWLAGLSTAIIAIVAVLKMKG